MNEGESSSAEARASVRSGMLLVSLVLASLLILARLWLFDALQRPEYVTGWITAFVVLGFAAAWWFRAEKLERRLADQLALSTFLLTAFAVHVDFHWPNGVLDWVLSSWLLLSVVSLVVGYMRTSRSWLVLHLALIYGLASAALFHGLHVHAHGLLAHWVLDR